MAETWCEINEVCLKNPSQEWQWCYFEHADSGRRESTYKHNDDDGDRFEESEFGCSFLIDNVTRWD